jgi:hypothetical protein
MKAEKKINKITLTGVIKDNELDYDTNNWRKQINELKADNEGEDFIMIIEVTSKPEYFLHKYYRGELLPELQKSIGDNNEFVTHINCKRDFLKIDCCDLEEMPKKYLSSVSRFTIAEIENPYSIENLLSGLSGSTILIYTDNYFEEVIGYIPSLADLTHKEFQKYINKVENRFTQDCQGAFTQEQLELKQRGLK